MGVDRRDPATTCRAAAAYWLSGAAEGVIFRVTNALRGGFLISRISRDFGLARLWPWIEKSPTRRFAFAAIVAAVAVLLHWLIFPLTHGRTSFIFFPPAIILVTTIAGRWPGVLVASIGVLNSALQKDTESLFVFNSAEQVAVIASALVAAMLIWVGDYYRSISRRELLGPARAPRAQRHAGLDPEAPRSAPADHVHVCAHARRGQGTHFHP